MKILITNHTLRQRGGSELFTAEITCELLSRGHEVCVFSTDPGEVSNELEKLNIPVVDDPGDCPFTPDIIHGQHHLETMTALCLWPNTPAVYMIHGSVPWEEQAPRHPRIMQYLAPSSHFGWIIERDCGVKKTSLGIVRNFFDSKRFTAVKPTDQRTGRALVYHNTTPANGKNWNTLKNACNQANLTLEGIGASFEKTTKTPETVLPDYDVVFAAGRSAIEAMACGCSVILIGAEAMTARVNPDNFDSLMEFNFCPHDQDKPIESSFALEQLDLIRPDETAAVTTRAREELSIDATLGALEKFYQSAIDNFALGSWNKTANEKNIGRYILSLAAKIKDTDKGRADLVEQKNRAKRRAERWKHRTGKLNRRLEWIEDQMEHKAWWHARLWRKLRRDWEAREKGTNND